MSVEPYAPPKAPVADRELAPKPKVAPRVLAIALFAAAVVLHAYEAFVLADGPAPGIFLWQLMPYVVCMLFYLTGSRAPVIVGASVALALDALVHYDVFINPQSSTAALAMLFVPLWSALIIVPVCAFIAWLIVRKVAAGRRENAL